MKHTPRAITHSPRAGSRDEPSDPSMRRVIVLTAAAFVTVRLAAVLFGGWNGMWGIDYAAFPGLVRGHPDWMSVLALALPLAALLPPVRNSLADLLRPAPAGAGGFGAPLLAIVLLLGFLWLLTTVAPVAFAFLGDGSYYAGEVFRVISDPAYSPAFIKPSAWLTGVALKWIAVTWTPENPQIPFTVIGLAGGVVLITAAVFAVRGARRPVAVLFGSTFLLAGGSLFFLGYIEMYAVSYAFAAMYLLTGWAFLRGRAPVWIAAASLAAACAFGAGALVFAPSLLFLLHVRMRGTGGPVSQPRAAVLLSIASVLVFVAVYAWQGGSAAEGYLIPFVPVEKVTGGLGGQWQRYTLLEPRHLLDVLNVLLLNASVWVVLVPVLLIAGRTRIDVRDSAMLFTLTVLVPSLLFLLFGNAFLGLARDWDLAAVPALAVAFAGVLLLEHLELRKAVSIRAVAPILMLTLAGGLVSWIRVNADGPASALRLEAITERDTDLIYPINTYTALENLRKYAKIENVQQHLRILMRMIETGYHTTDTYEKYLTVASRIPDPSRRASALEALYGRLERDIRDRAPAGSYRRIPDDELHAEAALALLAGAYGGHDGLVRAWLPRFSSLLRPWKEQMLVDAVLGRDLTTEARASMASSSVDTATRNPRLLIAVAGLQYQAARYRDASALYSRSMAIEPSQYPDVYIALARISYERFGDADSARMWLERCVARSRGTAEAAEARSILQRLGPSAGR